MKNITLEEIKAMDTGAITSRVAAGYLGCTQQLLVEKAKAGKLEFPFFFSGNRLKILREPFIEMCSGKGS